MKKKTLTAILLCLIPLFLTGCTIADLPIIGNLFSGKNISGAPVTLNMWGLWESPDVMKVLIEKYKVLHPNVTINYDDRSVVRPSQYKDTVVGRISQVGAPDVLLVHNSWVSQLKDSLSPMPTKLMTAQTYTSTFYPVTSQSAVIGGTIYAAPAHYDGLVLVYNKAHFKEINQNTPPTAWEEFKGLAKLLTIRNDKGDIQRAGAAIGSADNIDFFADILGLMFAQANVTVPSDLTSKPAQDALTFYTNFVNQDKVWSSAFPESLTAFAQGKVSMVFVPTWDLLDLVKNVPTLDIGVAPVPQAFPTNPTSWASFWMYAVPKSSQNAAAAWDFINFLIQDDQELSLFSEAAKYRAYGAPFSSVALAVQAASGPASKYIKPALDTAPFAKSSYLTGRSGNALQVDALKTAVNVMVAEKETDRLTPDLALKACKDTLMGVTPTTTTQ